MNPHRPLKLRAFRYIGKESNALEDVEAGLIQSAESVYTEYCDPRRGEWATKLLPLLKQMPLSVRTRTSKIRSVPRTAPSTMRTPQRHGGAVSNPAIS